jgi:hypothetical protein
MQVYANSNRVSLKTFLFFIVTLFIAFLPVSSFLFFLKDDAFTAYFPPKFFMSESIHAGYLPLWNPYINFGIPQYGDMSSGFWSPITWLIASTLGYNAYTFTMEVLLYILIGGLGMYILTGIWQLDQRVRIIAGIAFMCCGYNIGHLQHFNWLSGAAFLPWSFWSYLLLLKKSSLKNIIRASLVFYLLVSSAHPGIIISAAYFFIAILVFYFFLNEKNLPISTRIKNAGKSHLLFLIIFFLLAAGMITGYLDILPYFSRGEKISLTSSLSNTTSLKSWISVLFPFAIVKNNALYLTDVSMRNCYFSLSLLLFFLVAIVRKKTNWQVFLLITGFVFAILSFGGIFKTFAYKSIPLIGYIRLNGEFRIFSLLSFIIVASMELDKFIKQKNKFEGTIKWIYIIIELTLMTSIIVALYKAIHTQQSFLFAFKDAFVKHGIATKFKAFIDTISFYDTIWIQGIIQLLLLWGIKWTLKFKNWDLLKKIVIADMIIASLFNIPFTGVGKTSVSHIQEMLDRSPKGIPIPTLQPIIKIDTLSTEEKSMIGDWSMYNKQIGVTNEVAYPIILKNMDDYFDRKEKDTSLSFDQFPYLFIAKINNDSMISQAPKGFDNREYQPIVTDFSPDKISLTIHSDSGSNIVYLQNFYPHWYYQTSSGKKEVKKAGINFMCAPVAKGDNNITFSFEPSGVKKAMLLSLISFIICFLLLIFLKPKPASI